MAKTKPLSPSEMGRMKWNGMTRDDQEKHIKKMVRGTKRRMAAMTPEERSKMMKKVRAKGKQKKRK